MSAIALLIGFNACLMLRHIRLEDDHEQDDDR
jgi:hypothetical protein